MSQAVRCGKSLRAIGQNLESLEVESFQLDITGDHYSVRGEFSNSSVIPEPEPIATKSFFGFIRKVGKKQITQSSAPDTYRISDLQFTDADIETLDQKGRILRAKSDDCTLNPQSVAQVLRTAGADLDHKNCRPLKLSWYHQTLTVVHVNGHGVERTETYLPADLYNLWVHQFKQRSKPTGAG